LALRFDESDLCENDDDVDVVGNVDVDENVDVGGNVDVVESVTDIRARRKKIKEDFDLGKFNGTLCTVNRHSKVLVVSNGFN
jgi:hypothetical protein